MGAPPRRDFDVPESTPYSDGPCPSRFRTPAPPWYLNGARASFGERAWVFSGNVLLGALTHLFLDAFTHHGSPLVQAVPIFQSEALGLPWYTWLQIAFSALLLLAMIQRYADFLRRRYGSINAFFAEPDRRNVWIGMLAGGLTGAALWFFVFRPAWLPLRLHNLHFHLLIHSVNGAALVGMAFLMRAKFLPRRK